MKKRFFVFILMLTTVLFMAAAGIGLSAADPGARFSGGQQHILAAPFDKMPRTFDAVIQLPTSYADRGGVILGNYGAGTVCINFELYGSGQPRLYYTDEAGTVYNYVFGDVDVRSDDAPVRLTMVNDPDAGTITCYLNGEAKQTIDAPELPDIIPEQAYSLGGDLRAGNGQNFKGMIYQFSVYSDPLTAEQITSGTGTGLMASYDFTAETNQTADLSGNGYNLSGELIIFDPDDYVEPEISDGLVFEVGMTYQTGEDGYADVPGTYSAWVYLSQTHNDRGGVVIGNYQSGGIPCVSIEIAADGVPRFYHIDLNGNVTDLKFTDSDIRTGDWAHLAFTVTDVVSCYVNGEFIGEAPIAEFESLATETTIGIGGDLRSGNAQYFKGRIREIVLFEEALGADQISTLFKDGAGAVGEAALAHYDLTGAEHGRDIEDISGNGYTAVADSRFFADKDPVGEYDYTFAFIGDTQNITESYPGDLSKIYDWLVAGKDEQKIQYVFGLGDITNSDTDREWATALTEISKLDGVIPYSLARGNHDSVEKFTQNFSTDAYRSQFEGFYEDSILNTWRTFTAGSENYLLVTLDYGADDNVLNWAGEIIAAHPEHRVIVTTHAYLYRDGTTLDVNDVCPPSTSGGTNNGDDIWNKLISKHANIVLVVSGHDPSEKIVKRQVKGDNGNTVTQVLIDPQGLDSSIGATGMVALFHFSDGGNEIEVEYYSTVREKYFLAENQFKMTIPTVEEKPAEPEVTEPEEVKPEAEPEVPAEETPEDSAPEAEVPQDTEVPAEKGSAGVIMGVIAAVVVIGGAAGVLIAKKKKNG